ncbi:MAG TPA: formimidoylglutamate deiminase [Casimicrobiaceae bacterium]|nr:formimidoylglutamate deiminase [Casimicrobiaceae bacterium]
MRLVAPFALLPGGWADDVAIDIDAAGTIVGVTPRAAAEGGVRAAGPLVPGMPNLHSHAFQRALAGRTGRANAGGDSFWTWRQAMYGMLARIDADAFEAIATQAFVEMAKAGYTAVAEFHYVHRDPQGAPYADPAELAHRVVAAAAEAGIALTLLPVFYAHAGFGGAAPAPGQHRFVHTVDSFAQLIASLADDVKARGVVLGVAPHSLRAVTPDELAAVAALAAAGAPIHIHAAEQAREVAECLAWSGARPIEWLLDHAAVDARWCVVHATHVTPDEARRLAASGATAGLAPTTEADLGDGTFPARAFLDAGGAFGVGSDSNTIVDPFVELRQLEWSQRLALQSRNVLATAEEPVGTALYARAARGGGRALARPTGAIAAGMRADLVVLDAEDAALSGVPRDALLDAAIFGPCRRPVRDVMVGGRWVVRDGRHPGEDRALRRYGAAIAGL